ncbi:hypothetical protein RIF29_15782 [Crotalaria pallida]|uniref:Endonuclease/exonuclease/phosphatase n=1 Tax=Crotalaria pallida TaxID=3830 RepID=A0AAN9FFE1_CROPI
MLLFLNRQGLLYSPAENMKILCWNNRGLGNPRVVQALILLIRMNIPSLVFLSETKLFAREVLLLKRFGFSNGVAVDCSDHRGGGLALFWKDPVDVALLSYFTGHVDIRVTHLSSPISDHAPILMQFEYAQQRRRLKGNKDCFFFETMWVGVEQCESIVANSWNSFGADGSLNAVAGKLHLTGLKLADWIKRELPNIPKELKRLQYEQDTVDTLTNMSAEDYQKRKSNPPIVPGVLDVVGAKV